MGTVLDATGTGPGVLNGLERRRELPRDPSGDFLSKLRGARLDDFDLDRVFRGFEIESSARSLERLNKARTERLADG